MTLLHNREAFVTSKFTIDAQDHAEHEDTALIDRILWNSLTRETIKSRLCVCIEPVVKVWRPQRNALRKLVCWAELNEEIEHLAVPASWPVMYKNVFGEVNSMLRIAIHEPLPLQEVFLTAFSAYAYEVANASMSTLEMCFSRSDKILRYGTIYDFDPRSLELSVISQPQSLSYRLEMSMPVLQGYAKLGITNFVIALGGAVESSLRFSENLPEDLDSFEINEDFLRSSIPRLLSLPPVEERETSIDSTASPGHFILRPWPGCFSSDATFYVCTTDIVGLGVLNGDWVMARNFDGARQRLVRIEADDRLVDTAGIIVGSPVLVRNLCPEVGEDMHPNASCRIVLQPIRFGGTQPAIPFAESITVERIASPSTINKAYQHILLESLRKYFGFCTRVVQHGDIVGIPLDTDEEHIIEQLNDKMVGSIGHYRRGRSNEMAFFRITMINLRVTSANTAENIEKFRAQCKTGELGCRIDPASTRVIQKGIENCQVPYLVRTPGCWNDSYPALTFSGPSASSLTDEVYGKLLKLVQAALTRNAMNYCLNLSILLEGARGIGKFSITRKVAQQVGMHLMELNCFEIMDESDTKTEGTIKYRFEQANHCAPCLLVLRHVEAFANPVEDTEIRTESKWSRILRECFEQAEENWTINRRPVIIVGTTSEPDQVPSSVLSSFKHRYNCKAPSEQGRREILKDLLADVIILPDVSLEDLAAQTAAFVPSDLNNFVKLAKLSSLERCMSTSVLGPSAVAAGIPLTSLDFERALKKSTTSYIENIGAPRIPKVSWNDIGGLATVKADILDTVRLPFEHPELFADGLKKRSGLLLYGPPGTGKTLIAKAVATSFSMNFISVKGPELLNMYIGESEANVRKIFQRARDASPCVIFFDELDSIAPKRGSHGDSGGVMDRIVSQILAELDGVASTDGNVFVLGATNRPDLLDPALLRPGRFDKMLYLGISDTPEAQVHILQALTRKFRLDPALSLYRLAEKCPLNCTGADFYALCSDALLVAMSRIANEINETVDELNRRDVQCHPITVQYYLAEMVKQEELLVVVKEADFDLALRNLIPSVSQLEMERYIEMKTRFNT
ncbi:hypothetical protein APHAL10511_001383 [Amanita phalloides]|nr:hypothetical protein APHAL10511_001383 [Amanita phalloides]